MIAPTGQAGDVQQGPLFQNCSCALVHIIIVEAKAIPAAAGNGRQACTRTGCTRCRVCTPAGLSRKLSGQSVVHTRSTSCAMGSVGC
jgi:hypothetical protein